MAAVKQMEVRVAKAVGLAGVFGSQPTQLAEPSYRCVCMCMDVPFCELMY